MATRSLTEVFILMRNNAMQSRHIFSDQIMDDRVALVHRDPELGINANKDSRLPPEWVDSLEEVQYQITRIKQMMKELAKLHNNHLTRPTLDDNTEEEQAIENATQEITQMFSYCQRTVQQIRNKSKATSPGEFRLSNNVIHSLVSALQDLSLNFRQSQSAYLTKLQQREERSQQYFDSTYGNGSIPEEEYSNESFSREFNKEQLLFLEDNTKFVQTREREVSHIVRSIAELNDIFKDLASMVVDQGFVLDRIDCNIEQSQMKVHQGLQQLQKAEKIQKKNRKMFCILVLAVTTTVLIIVLIGIKS